ncbi:MAG: N-acetylmuramoyl-L-alanine amidase, partial [Bacteroidales bacterium]
MKIRTVVIDPGHGGSDPGAIGKFSKEKDITLSVSLKFGELIEKNFPNIKVIYTRKDDRFVELYKRADIANKNNADLFICVHVNAST